MNTSLRINNFLIPFLGFNSFAIGRLYLAMIIYHFAAGTLFICPSKSNPNGIVYFTAENFLLMAFFYSESSAWTFAAKLLSALGFAQPS